MIVVSDSTILIGLVKIGKLDLLKETFSKVYIPEEVFKEVVESHPASQRPAGLQRDAHENMRFISC